MCDTIVVLGKATKDNSVLFGKNSDREPNEAQNIVHVPRKKHQKGTKVKCTYISVPQVEETYEVLLSQPFWMFGAEMGSNEFGVTIGNEAVFTKEPLKKEGLLGMDMLRLALERSKTADEALDIIIRLLDTHGQGGICGFYNRKMNYHNSFIIADTSTAWVLETAGKYWITEKVKDIRTISNTLTIGKNYNRIHPELIQHAIEEGYCNSEEDFHFANCFIAKFSINQIGAKGKKRKAFTETALNQKKGSITPETIKKVLRMHRLKKEKERVWTPSKGSMKNVCMHAASFLTPSQSVSSMVSHLKEDKLAVHWITGTSAPCTGVYLPIILPGIQKLNTGEKAEQNYNPETLWWLHEKLHRLVLKDYKKRLAIYSNEKEQMEKTFSERVENILAKDQKREDEEENDKLTKEAFELIRKKTKEWIKAVEDSPIGNKPCILYRWYWKRRNKKVGLKI